MDLRRLRAGEWLMGASGLLLFVALFLPWYELGQGIVTGPPDVLDAHASAWDAFTILDVLLALGALAAIAVVVVTALEATPAVPIAMQALVTLFAILLLILVVFRLADPPDVTFLESTSAPGARSVVEDIERDAGALAEAQERNAWQEDGKIDRIILICLLLTSALGVGAAFWRASGREARGLGPYALVGLSATVTALLVLYRVIQEPGFDELTTVQIGAPLALGVLGVIAFGAATSLRAAD